MKSVLKDFNIVYEVINDLRLKMRNTRNAIVINEA